MIGKGSSAALPHRIPRACDRNEHRTSRAVPHGQAVLVRSTLDHREVDSGRLLNEGHQIAERLGPEMMCAAELSSRAAPSYFRERQRTADERSDHGQSRGSDHGGPHAVHPDPAVRAFREVTET
jgi:hypothetical protein